MTCLEFNRNINRYLHTNSPHFNAQRQDFKKQKGKVSSKGGSPLYSISRRVAVLDHFAGSWIVRIDPDLNLCTYILYSIHCCHSRVERFEKEKKIATLSMLYQMVVAWTPIPKLYVFILPFHFVACRPLKIWTANQKWATHFYFYLTFLTASPETKCIL